MMAAAMAAAVLAGCGGDGDDEKSSPTTRRSAASDTTLPVAADVFPLTGLPGDAATRSRPPLVVKIDNYAEKSYPQFGIGLADIVVCEGVEGGITRLAVMFHSKDAATIGPVRSARSSDLHLAEPLGQPLFAYSGTNGNFQELIDRSPLVDLSPNKAGGAYRRQAGRPAPYNLFSGTPQLFGAAAGKGAAPKPLLRISAAATPEGTPVTKLDVHWKMPDRPTRTDVSWSWSGVNATRQQNGRVTVDAAGPKVTPRNVVVLFVEYVDTGERDQSRSIVPEAKLDGTGEAWVIRDGKLTKGKWNKAGGAAPIVLEDAQGRPIDLLPGQTWIELPAPGNASVA